MNHSHSQPHLEIRRILDAALDQPLDAETQAALDLHLAECTECRSYAESLKRLETRLGPVLESRWPPASLSDGQRASILGNILSHSRRNPMQTRISSSMRALAMGTLAILLVLVLGWGIRTLKPTSPAGGGGTQTVKPGWTPSTPTEEGRTPSAPTQETPATLTEEVRTPLTPTETTSAPTKEESPVPTITPQATLVGSVAVFPKLQFSFATEFPAAPDKVEVYQQQFSEPVTVDLARQAAAALGVNGEVVQSTGEGGGTIYDVHGGGSVIRFLGYADQFMYEVLPTAELNNSTQMPSFEQQVAIAEDFLRQKGLLKGRYHVESIQGDPGVVRFVQLLDDREVRYGVGANLMGGPLQWIDVSVTADGAVDSMAYNDHHFQPFGQYPILSAQQAWERFSANAAGNYGMYAVLSAERPSTYQSWLRDYAVGPVHIYDYAENLQSAEGGAALISFSRYPVTGATQGMPMGKLLHAWGQIVLDDQGNKTFQVEGWELSTLADSKMSGKIQRQGDTAILHTDDGQWLPVPDLPAGVPDGAQVNVRGVTLNGSLEWSYIDTGELPNYYGAYLTCGGGGSGGDETPEADFGGSSLAWLNLAGMPSEPNQPVPPYQAGDTLDGQIGIVWVTINKYADHTETKAAMWVEAADGTIFVAQLSGAGLSGIEQHNALPIKVWGHVDEVKNGQMYFTVDRFEEAYPGLRAQAWIGTEEAVTLEGKDALLFTSLDGQQYIRKGSIGYGEKVRLGQPGEAVILEGWVIPGVTYGGYAVIQDLVERSANGQTDLSGYTLMTNHPEVNDVTQEEPVFSPSSVIQGQVSIDQIELVYLAYSLADCQGMVTGYYPNGMMYVQPVWRFRGKFADGRSFEVLVQALTDSDLTFEMGGG